MIRVCLLERLGHCAAVGPNPLSGLGDVVDLRLQLPLIRAQPLPVIAPLRVDELVQLRGDFSAPAIVIACIA